MEVQPPVSPQQSECNPVGALQVCPILIFCACLSSLELGAVREGSVGRLPCLRAIHPPVFLLLPEASRVGGRGCEVSFLTQPCVPLFPLPRSWWCRKAGGCLSTR